MERNGYFVERSDLNEMAVNPHSLDTNSHLSAFFGIFSGNWTDFSLLIILDVWVSIHIPVPEFKVELTATSVSYNNNAKAHGRLT